MIMFINLQRIKREKDCFLHHYFYTPHTGYKMFAKVFTMTKVMIGHFISVFAFLNTGDSVVPASLFLHPTHRVQDVCKSVHNDKGDDRALYFCICFSQYGRQC